jgi:hypothetical protein
MLSESAAAFCHANQTFSTAAAAKCSKRKARK